MNKLLATIAVILGLACAYVGIVYLTHGAGSLPHYYPGYLSGSDHVHIKHGIASFVVAIALFVYAWFQTGPKPTT